MAEAAHDVSLPYQEVEIESVSGFEVTRPNEESVVVKGRCPRCGEVTTTTFFVQSPQGSSTKALGDRLLAHVRRPIEHAEATVICDCGAAHPDRPDDAEDNGCGAYWTVKL